MVCKLSLVLHPMYIPVVAPVKVNKLVLTGKDHISCRKTHNLCVGSIQIKVRVVTAIMGCVARRKPFTICVCGQFQRHITTINIYLIFQDPEKLFTHKDNDFPHLPSVVNK